MNSDLIRKNYKYQQMDRHDIKFAFEFNANYFLFKRIALNLGVGSIGQKFEFISIYENLYNDSVGAVPTIINDTINRQISVVKLFVPINMMINNINKNNSMDYSIVIV